MNERESIFERVQKIYDMIELVASMSTTLDLETILLRALQLSEEIMEAEASSVLLLDEEKKQLYFEVARGSVGDKLKKRFALNVGEGIAGWVALFQEPLLIEDAYSDPRFNPKFDKETGFRTQSILCVPLEAGDKLVGVAQVINKREGGVFTAEDLRFFQAFCSLIAVAIENARMHQRELERAQLENQLQFAKEIQKSFLPTTFPRSEEYRFAASNSTAYEVGGDLYDVFESPNGNIYFVLGDVSGKGISAALYMARFLSDARHYLTIFDTMTRAIYEINNLLAERSLRGMFITAVIGRIAVAEGRVELVNAGHHPVTLMRKGEILEMAQSTAPPLGILEEMEYQSETIDFLPTDKLLIYTDGVTEAMNWEKEQFGCQRLLDILMENKDASIEQIVERVIQAVKKFVGTQPQNDDITLLGIERCLQKK